MELAKRVCQRLNQDGVPECLKWRLGIMWALPASFQNPSFRPPREIEKRSSVLLQIANSKQGGIEHHNVSAIEMLCHESFCA